MFTVAGIGFSAPWLLLALAALPILWLLLRAVPPAPIRRMFPGVSLLLGLKDDESQSDKTPWWLLLLRMLAVAAMIVGFAGPVLNPQDGTRSNAPLMILVDATWAASPDWQRRVEQIEATLQNASRDGRRVALVSLVDLPVQDDPFSTADDVLSRLPSFAPMPYEPDWGIVQDWAAGLVGNFETVWFSDGLDATGRGEFLTEISRHGPVSVIENGQGVIALRPVVYEDGIIKLSLARTNGTAMRQVNVQGIGLDPGGTERILATVPAELGQGEVDVQVELNLPPELRNRITRFQIADLRSAGAVTLTDDTFKRREVAIIAGRDNREGLELLSPTHYLEQALVPTADIIDGTIQDVLLANPDVLILADVASLAQGEDQQVADWVDEGGLLLRFAGPRLAASGLSRDEEDPLMPVRLRAGGRNVGGAMSWGEPKDVRAFVDGSPFFGLSIPNDVRVSAQVLAQPDPNLGERVIAALADGTPLVTRKRLGQGQVVLFHVTANAEWSTLPLSGLFVQMLERLAVSTRPAGPDATELAGTNWIPEILLDAFGSPQDAGNVAGVPGETLAIGIPSRDMAPGLYRGEDRVVALNVMSADKELRPAVWPGDVTVSGFSTAVETALKGLFLTVAILFLVLDVLASLWVSGRLLKRAAQVATAVLGIIFLQANPGQAQDDDFALDATSEVVLAHVITGNAELDRVAFAGMRGLSDVLFLRTSIEPASPLAVNLETDELSFFPFIYWPVSSDQPMPSAQAYNRLNRYLRSGGMILFDTMDANVTGFGTASPNGRKLQQLAAPLDIPPLEPVPEDHVLTRSFYLLQDFPGRFLAREVWVEAAPADALLAEGMPFRNLNDNVTPVVIGGNDWASAWAVDAAGNPMFPVGRGQNGERQREMAYRFGVNLLMHVLTGNYKSDQVHVPALLDRLGQ